MIALIYIINQDEISERKDGKYILIEIHYKLDHKIFV